MVHTVGEDLHCYRSDFFVEEFLRCLLLVYYQFRSIIEKYLHKDVLGRPINLLPDQIILYMLIFQLLIVNEQEFLHQKTHPPKVSTMGQSNPSADVSRHVTPLDALILEFVFEPDPNLYMRKNNIQIFGTVEMPETCAPDVGFAAKLFSMMTVEVNSQLVSNNRNK